MKIKGYNGREIEVGEKGDIILVRSTPHNGSHLLAKLDDVVAFGKREKESLSFEGKTYHLSFIEVMGVRIPCFSYRGSRSPQDAQYIDDVIVGPKKIVAYLRSPKSGRYSEHADLVERALGNYLK